MSFGPAPAYLSFVGATACALLVAGCADTRGGSIPYDRPLALPDKPQIVALASDYKIHPMDKITVKVFKAPDLSGDYDVDLTGKISMPLIGEVEAINLTTAELDQRLTDKLGQKYLEHPDVAVAIKQSTSQVVTVDGAVRESGSYPTPGPLSLIQTVAMAKGTTEDANPRRVAVFRTVGGQRMAAAFDLTAIRRGEAKDPQIYPGDIVVVDGSAIKAAQKQLLQTVPMLALFTRF
ncbi:MAG: polysaccharide biosynthesis/export family protein [Pseudomonadota bacterium]